MASPEALQPFVVVLQALDTVMAAYSANIRVLEAIAEGEALIRAAFESLSARLAAGLVFQEAVSELVGAYLTDSAHLLFHSNLRRMIDSYGIAPYLDDALSRAEVTNDPFPTQFPLPYSAAWFRTQADRLGSSTLRGLEQPPPESGFAGWQAEVVDAFYDRGDFQRPAFPDSYEAGALLITVQAVDPKELFDKFSGLIRLLTKKPAELVLPRISRFVSDMWNSIDMWQYGSMATAQYIRPHLTAGSWSTSPDFVRVGTQDLIPLIGDVMLDFRGASAAFSVDPPSSKALEDFARGLGEFVERFERVYGQMLASLNTVVALMSQPGFSRLWIPVEAGGSERIVQEILAAESTRKDVQRVVDGGLTGASGHERGAFITYEQAIAAQTLDASFRFKPAENMLVAGAVIVLNKGPLATLIESAFAPKQEDRDESDGIGPPAFAGDLFEASALAVRTISAAGLPSSDWQDSRTIIPTRRGGRNPTDQEPSWVEAPIVQESPVGPTQRPGGSVAVRSRQPRATAFRSRDGVALQIVRPGATRNTVLRRDGSTTEAPVLGAETRPADLTAATVMSLVSPTTAPTVTAPGIPWACFGSRAPVGEAPPAAEEVPQSMLPMSALTRGWEAYDQVPVVVDVDVEPGTGAFTSVALDALVVGTYGYAGMAAHMLDLTPAKKPWWLDLVVEWTTYDPGGSTTRSAAVRVQVMEVLGAPGATRFTTSPALPSYPVVAASAYSDGIVWAGQALGLPAGLEARTGTGGRADFVEQQASGVSFESLASWRRALSDEPDEGLLPTLQAHALGVLVDSDTGQVGRRRAAILARKTNSGLPGLVYLSATHPTLGAWEPVHATHPLPSSALATAEELFTGDDFRPAPLRATGGAWGRAADPVSFPYYVLSPEGTAGGVTAEDYLSSRLPELVEDSRLLSTHVLSAFRVGLGVVSGATVSVPPAAPASTATIVTLDAASGIWTAHTDAVDPAALDGGTAIPTPAFAAAYAGVPWAVDLTWDTLTGAVVGAALLPTVRRTAQANALYDGKQPVDPGIADAFLTNPGAAIEARYGAGASGDSIFSVSGRADGETAWVDLPQLLGTSRRTEEEQGYSATLTFIPMQEWVGRGSTWTLLETASHLLVVRSGGPCFLEVFEKDLLSSDIVRRTSVAIPDPVPGRRYQAAMSVEPFTATVKGIWRQADDDTSEEVTYSDVAADTQIVGVADAYPYPRALDGYPLTGATIRVGRPLPPILLEARLAVPYVDSVTIYIAGAPAQQSWAIGTLPLALLAVEAAPTPALSAP